MTSPQEPSRPTYARIEHIISRNAKDAFTVAFLAAQAVLPLRYYLSDEREDERFSWRMFSSVRMRECELHVTEVAASGSAREVGLDQTLHRAWIAMIERGQPIVVDRYLAHRCRVSSAKSVRIARMCRAASGETTTSHEKTRICRTGRGT
jgi:hypothetical protein